MTRNRLAFLALALQLAALACLGVAYTKRDSGDVDGPTRFSRSVGEDAVLIIEWSGEVRGWLIASAVFLSAGIMVWLWFMRAEVRGRRTLL